LTARKRALYEHGVARRKAARESRAPVDAVVLRFTEDHAWVRVDGERAQVGLSDHMAEALGDIIAVELPALGERLERGAPFGEVESVRTVREFVAPVTGTVTAVNEELEEQPELLNEDPYHEGWLVEVKLSNEAELDELISADEYDEAVSSEKV